MPIEIKNLTYVYNPKTPFCSVALDDVSFTIADGDFFGIIGHTGSGKSTLVSHINGLTPIQQGSIIVDGISLAGKYDYKKLRSTVGMVFQYPEYQLFAETVAADVAFGPRNLGLNEDEVTERSKEALNLIGLDYDKYAERSPFDLSGGQKRKVALAGVLAMRPRALILDEPTAGLDPVGKQEVLDLIVSLKEVCPTIVMISHNMDEVAKYCNRIAVLHSGKLRGVFTPSQLFEDSDIVAELDLEQPNTVKISRALMQRGVLNRIYSDENELTNAIIGALGGGRS